jgi:hypothetical protein
LDATECKFNGQADGAPSRGDQIQARQFQITLEEVGTTHAIYELLDINLDCKGNFYCALANDLCDIIHFPSLRKESVLATTLSYFASSSLYLAFCR